MKLTPSFASAGKIIRTARENSGFSLRHLAKKVNVSPSALSQIELGTIRPCIIVAVNLCNALRLAMPSRQLVKTIWSFPEVAIVCQWDMLTPDESVGGNDEEDQEPSE